MPDRLPELQTFLQTAEAAFTAHANDSESRNCITHSFAALRQVQPGSDQAGARLPVCDTWLPDLLTPTAYPPDLRPLIADFAALEPELVWQTRKADGSGASADFRQNHANAMLVGPNGLEPRRDVWLGVSLLAPGTRFPDHRHPPEEVYLVLTPGAFLQEGKPWFAPGPGGSFYNRPGINHAMRAAESPLFAFWILRAASD